jgi:hypothetical protein
MGQDSQVIRRDIEETRARLGDTVDALSYKADVKERARDYVGDKTGAVTGGASSVVHRVADAADSVVHKVSGTAPSPGAMRDTAGTAADRGKGLAQENPIGLAVAGAAVGFLIGLVLPSTRVEDERIGPVADEVKDLAKETGQEAIERGKAVADEVKQTTTDAARMAAQDIAETAKEQGREQGQELVESTRSQARDTAEAVREQGSPQG